MVTYKVIKLNRMFRKLSVVDAVSAFQKKCSVLYNENYQFTDFSPVSGEVIFKKDEEKNIAKRQVKILYCNDMDREGEGLEAVLNEFAKKGLILRKMLSYPSSVTPSYHFIFALLDGKK